ncbi:MAG: DeoR/GlpR family DNA-binding transcription regulator [Eubacteriales bacterium]|jgi:DeoR family fructose operon transcriptional repressor
MIKQKRLDNILNYLAQNKAATLSELAKLNGVSLDTVRNDLAELERGGGMVKRVHGGAVYHSDDSRRQVFRLRNVARIEEKTELATLIDDLVADGQAVAINNGTTNVVVAKRLAKTFTRLTIVTNSLSVVQVFTLAQTNSVIIPGGALDHSENCLYGGHCEEEISSYNIDTAIIAANAISLEKGITDFRLHEEGIIKAMLKNAKTRYVVADSSKFDSVSFINICSLDQIDAIITDSKLEDEVYQRYTESGVRIIRPKKPEGN